MINLIPILLVISVCTLKENVISKEDIDNCEVPAGCMATIPSQERMTLEWI